MTAVRLLAVGGVVGAAAVRSHDDAGAGGEKNLPGGGDRVVTGLEGEGTVTGTDAREGYKLCRHFVDKIKICKIQKTRP